MTEMNLEAAAHAGKSVVDSYLDRNLNRGEQLAREVIKAALPHLAEVFAIHLEARYFDVAAQAVRADGAAIMSAAAQEVVGAPITVPWASTPDGAGDSVHIGLSNERGRYLIVANGMYATPEQVGEVGEACRAIAKLPVPEALPPRESRRPRRQTACTDGE